MAAPLAMEEPEDEVPLFLRFLFPQLSSKVEVEGLAARLAALLWTDPELEFYVPAPVAPPDEAAAARVGVHVPEPVAMLRRHVDELLAYGSPAELRVFIVIVGMWWPQGRDWYLDTPHSASEMCWWNRFTGPPLDKELRKFAFGAPDVLVVEPFLNAVIAASTLSWVAMKKRVFTDADIYRYEPVAPPPLPPFEPSADPPFVIRTDDATVEFPRSFTEGMVEMRRTHQTQGNLRGTPTAAHATVVSQLEVVRRKCDTFFTVLLRVWMCMNHRRQSPTGKPG